MRIKRVYITHTCYCSGWDIDSIFEGTLFAKAIHTNQKYEDGVKMLDWDFRKPDWSRHLEKVRNHDFECVMAPDVASESDVNPTLDYVEKLLDHCNRVVIPIHYYDERLEGYELAYPNAKKFNVNARKELGLIFEFSGSVTHILGGAPQSQLRMRDYFPNLRSLDGNLIFWCAVWYGQYWDGRWCKQTGMTNQECFALSVKNLNKAVNNGVVVSENP